MNTIKNSMFKKKDKIVGTLVPLAALWSKKEKKFKSSFQAAFVFLDWLKRTGQSAWQMLPLHESQLEPGSKNKHISSPYKSYGIGLSPSYLSPTLPCSDPKKGKIKKFVKKNKDWLFDYALFCALRDHFKTDHWIQWPLAIKKRKTKALKHWQKKLASEIKRQIKLQWQLHCQYSLIRQKAKKNKILLIGDLPYYLCLASPLVWSNQGLFDLNKDGQMNKVSGSPAGPSSSLYGRQLWGHPLYYWQNPENQEKILKLFKLRLKFLSNLFDWVRLDYAKGFFKFGVLDPKDSSNDSLRLGPGKKALKEFILFAHSLRLDIFCEDSGARIKKLRLTLKKLKVPGVRIFRFGLIPEEKQKIHLKNLNIFSYPVNAFAYTTTHDTKTLLGYLKSLNLKEKKILTQKAKVKFSPDNVKLALRLRQALINCPAKWVIIPLQDWLLTEDRINTPGTEKEKNDPNWQYKLDFPVEQLKAFS